MNNENKIVPKLRFPEFQDAEEWKEKQLEQICEVNPSIEKLPKRFVYIDLESVEDGVLLQKKNITLDGAPSRAQRLLKIGDVIFQMVRPYQKNNYFFQPLDDFDYVASTGYAQLRAHQSSMYLFQYLHHQGFVDKVLAKCTGSSYPAINSSDLSKILIEIPDFKEQQKIATCLSSIDELIIAQSQKLDTLKTHKKGLMQQLFPAEGDASTGSARVPKLRFAEFRDDGEWEESKLGDKTIKVGSGITPEGGDKNYKNNGRPFVRSQNIGWGRLILENVAFIDETTHSTFSATEIELDDVLLNITGASIGRCALADLRIKGGNVNQHVCIIRTKNELCPFFLNQYLLSEFGQNQIDSFQAGGNRQGLNFAQIRSFTVPLPPKFEEQ
ncbi:MAG: restriction endonuclease subunit S, partial [Ignavibacteria bacterium]|nr:restriction endonuclease subunit S [Ignavibacteria bacterium]